MQQYVSHHHQDHFNMPGCNVLCCNTAINAKNRTLNTDMVTISFTPDIFQLALVNYGKARGSDCPMQLQWC